MILMDVTVYSHSGYEYMGLVPRRWGGGLESPPPPLALSCIQDRGRHLHLQSVCGEFCQISTWRVEAFEFSFVEGESIKTFQGSHNSLKVSKFQDGKVEIAQHSPQTL